MPRSRGAKQSSQSSCNITVSIQGEKILIRSTDNEKSFAWLAEETERIFHDRRQEPGSRFCIDGFQTADGNPVVTTSLLKDVTQSLHGGILTATGAYISETEEALGKANKQSDAHHAFVTFKQGLHKEAYGHNARVFDIAFAPSGNNIFATASDDGVAKVWYCPEDEVRCRQAASFHDHTDSVMCVSWSPSGDLIATGSADTTVHIWQSGLSAAGKGDNSLAGYGVHHVAQLQGHPEEVYAAEFLQGGSGSRMLTASTWLPYIWDLEICQQVAEGPPIQGPELIDNERMPERWQAGHIFSASQMPDGGKLIAASCSDGALRTWSLDCSHSTLEPHSISRPHALGMGSCCAWDLDGHCVASLATDGTLALLDVRMNSKVCWSADVGRPLFSCCFLPSHRHTLAVCGQGAGISLWDVSSASSERSSSNYDPKLTEDSGLPQDELYLCSRSKSMGQRSLLCVASSHDGGVLAASGEAVMTGIKAGGSQDGSGKEASIPLHKQSRRSAVELWQRRLSGPSL